MAQLVKCLSHKRMDLGLDWQDPHKEPEAPNPSAGGWGCGDTSRFLKFIDQPAQQNQ